MDKKITFGIIIASLVILIGSILFVYDGGDKVSNSDIVATAEVKIGLAETTYDWGEIGINDGNVEKEFTIQNSGTSSLKLYDVVTSCACTTAQLFISDEKSPVYGMNSKSGYVMEVPPGKSAKLRVIYDPLFHGPEGIGPITRQVFVKTNSIENPELSFVLDAIVNK